MEPWHVRSIVSILYILYKAPVASGQAYLVVADAARNGVFRMDVNGGSHVQFPLGNLKTPIAVGFDAEEGSLFVSERGTVAASDKFIIKYTANAGDPRKMNLDRISVPDGLAVDPISRLVYYTDTGEDYIAVTNTDLSWRAVVLRDDLDEPRAIALDYTKGTMYWTDWGTAKPHIGKAYMDGSKPKRIITQGLGFPNGLTLDPSDDVIFWCDAQTYTIEKANKDGSGRRMVYSRPLEHFFGIVLDETYLYWTSWNKGAIQRARKDGTGSPSDLGEVFPVNTTRMNGLAIVNPPASLTGSNACSGSDRGGCHQLCLPRKSRRTCACTDGFVLNTDGLTCDKLTFARSLLIVDQDRDGMFRLDLDRRTKIRIPFRGSRSPQGVVYDPITTNIFWTDAALRVVATGTLNGARASILKRFGDPAAFPEGIALDPIARMLYVVDSGRDVILRLTADGLEEKVLINSDLSRPRAIVLDLEHRRMYWSDWGSRPMIARAGMDGTSRQGVIETDVRWPNGLAIDAKAGRLYWTDGFLHRIESSNLDGKDRQIILFNSSTHYLGLTLGLGKLYFSARNDKAIYTVDRVRQRALSVCESEFRTVPDLCYVDTDPGNIPEPPAGTTPGEREGPSSVTPQGGVDGGSPPGGDEGTSPGTPIENSSNNTVVIAIAVTVGGLVLITIIIVIGCIWYRSISRQNTHPSSGVHDNRAFAPDIREDQKVRPLPDPPSHPILKMRPPAPLPAHVYSDPDRRFQEEFAREWPIQPSAPPELPPDSDSDEPDQYCLPAESTTYANLQPETMDLGGDYTRIIRREEDG